MKVKRGFDTLAIQAGEDPLENGQYAIRVPLSMSTSFAMPGFDLDTIEDMFLASDRSKYDNYTRWTNPTLRSRKDRSTALEGGEAGLAFAGRMAAISGPTLSEPLREEIIKWMGADGVVRTNVGLEDANDLIEDLDQALKGRSPKSRLAPLAYQAYTSRLQRKPTGETLPEPSETDRK